MLQEDELGTKDEIGSSNIHLYNSNLHLDLVPQEILVTAPELQEEKVRYKYYQLLLIRSISEFLNLVPQELILVTAPELQEDWLGTKVKKVALTPVIYIYNLSLYWCCKISWSWHQNCKRCPSTSLCELRCV